MLRWPTKHIAYVVTLIYLLVVGAITANVEWFDWNLPQHFNEALVDLGSSIDILGHIPLADMNRANGTNIAPVIGLLEAGKAYKTFGAVLLGLLVYSALSCANTNLYVASRTLYGLTRDLSMDSHSIFERLLAHLNIVTPTYRVPLYSIFFSLVLCASWLPFVKIGLNQQDVSHPPIRLMHMLIEQLFHIMSNIGSVGVLLVWMSQCLAFIRYNKWHVYTGRPSYASANMTYRLHKHRHHLVGNHARFQRWPISSGSFSSYCAAIQPVPAYIGLACCIIIVFIFTSADMWNHKSLTLKGLQIYLGVSRSTAEW
jgi:amino acid transporter